MVVPIQQTKRKNEAERKPPTGIVETQFENFAGDESCTAGRQPPSNKANQERNDVDTSLAHEILEEDLQFEIRRTENHNMKFLQSEVQNALLHTKTLKLAEENRRLQIKVIELEAELFASTRRIPTTGIPDTNGTLSTTPANCGAKHLEISSYVSRPPPGTASSMISFSRNQKDTNGDFGLAQVPDTCRSLSEHGPSRPL